MSADRELGGETRWRLGGITGLRQAIEKLTVKWFGAGSLSFGALQSGERRLRPRRALSRVHFKAPAHLGGPGEFFTQRELGMGREKIERPQAQEHGFTHSRCLLFGQPLQRGRDVLA